MCECVYILICWLAKLRKISFTGKNKIIKFYKKAFFKERQYAKAIVEESRWEKKKNPAAPKDHRVSPQVGVDGFEPPTLCL